LWQVPFDSPAAGKASVRTSTSVVGVVASQESSASTSTASSVIGILASQEGSGGDAMDASSDHNPWPSHTDLIFIPGTRKLTLTIQSALLRAIIHDAFENMHAFLLVSHSFPDATALPTVIKGCLVTAATESKNLRASDIRDRLMEDDMYLDTLSRLVSAS
jgi:hypothetical protein